MKNNRKINIDLKVSKYIYSKYFWIINLVAF